MLLLVVATLSCAACGGGSHDAKSLRAEARALVPAGSRVVAAKDGACVELADFPSCVTVWFDGGRRPLAERVRRARAAARAAGWSSTDASVGRGGTILRFRRESLTAWITLWSPLHDYFCKGRPRKDCVDELQVQRG